MPSGIGVVGAGAWGTTLAKVLADKGENQAYLPGIALPPNIEVTQSLDEAVESKFLVICAVPSHAVRQVFTKSAAKIEPETVLLCGTNGIEEGSMKTMGELLFEILGPERKNRQASLSGPTFAIEVARRLPAAVTVAAYDEGVAKTIQKIFSTQNFRVYTSPDIIGVQMGGVVKNVIAIAAGISDGLSLGQHARAALVTRGLAEMTRLAVRMGADPMTLAGLPGLGDLILTCTGDLSRNRTVGLQIASGKSLQEITASTRTVAEGVRNTRSLHSLASRLRIEMPIVDQLYQVLYADKKPGAAVRDLMQRSLKPEAG